MPDPQDVDMAVTTPTEQEAIRVDAEQRLDGLRQAAVRLWPHREDAVVCSELTVILGQIRAAEQELAR